jgi:alpha-tubulin suppressor-like RCC1 family protein
MRGKVQRLASILTSGATFVNTAIFGCFALICGNCAGQTLGDALDATNLTWTTFGTSASGWSVANNSPYSGSYDAASATLSGSGASSTLQTTVVGPGTLSFWWRNESVYCNLSFVSGSNTLATYGGKYSIWQSTTYYLGAGSNTFKWVYSLPASPSDFQHAYVDGVSYSNGPTAPFITTQPLSQSQVRGVNAAFTVAAAGTPPLAYQWRFNGTNIVGATSSVWTVTNVQSANLGVYSVLVTNSVNFVVSSDATLEFGQVTAWGLSGGLNVGATTVPPGATNLLAISSGGYFNFLLKGDHSLSGWGRNVYGDIVVPDGVSNVISIDSGTDHSLALLANGSVVVWGANYYGQTNMPTGLTNVVAVAAGDYHSLVLSADGTVAAWGLTGGAAVPSIFTNVVEISGGFSQSVGLNAAGNVIQWNGQSAPDGLSNVVEVAAGSGHFLALLTNGTVVAWGQNTYGQATVPAALSNVVAIAAGASHSIALQANGRVVAWGYNSGGVATVPTGLSNVVSIAAGEFHSLALVSDGPPVVDAMISNPAWTANGFVLSVPSQCGRVYSLQYKNSTSDANWASLPLVAGTGSTLLLNDPSATNAARIYRVLRW